MHDFLSAQCAMDRGAKVVLSDRSVMRLWLGTLAYMSQIPFIVAIPARYASTRLPGKPLQTIAGEPMVLHVARRALAAGASAVIVATDDARIEQALTGQPLRVVMTRAEHASGSDRLAECAERLGWPDEAIVVNLQGDEPLAPASGVRTVAECLAQSSAPMATLATPITDVAEFLNPNCVKVVVSAAGTALYFSRAPVPWPRDAFATSRDALPATMPFLRHVGIYAYRAGFLRTFAKLPPTPLERVESLEQLRALEHGYSIAVRIAPEPFPAGVDTPEDLARVRQLLQR
jgi:3-deoxy-manno-octulosonate cytidylyltransferase (CMP-KDO synthetase)